MGRLLKRIRHLFFGRRFESGLDEELRFHRAMIEHQGGDPAAFGNATLALEESRTVWSLGGIESLLQDLRYAVRGFLRQPAFALTVVGTIGLALGLNTTLFTVFNAYVLRPLSVRDPSSLYGFTWTNQRGAGRAFTVRDYDEVRQSGVAFSDVLAYQSIFGALNGH